MSKKTLNTTILSRTDTLENWTSKNPILELGEVGTCTTNGATFMKVGDGATHWNDLPMTSGLAGDVYSWAKASTKPTYTAEEVGALPSTTVIPTINGSSDANVTSAFAVMVTKIEGLENLSLNDFSGTYPITIDKTTEQIEQAFTNGYVPVLVLNQEGLLVVLPFSGSVVQDISSLTYYYFSGRPSLLFGIDGYDVRAVIKEKNSYLEIKKIEYSQISGTPTIGNGEITINQAGEKKASFTLNQTGNLSIDLTDSNTTYSPATSSSDGLMSASDKARLDSLDFVEYTETEITNLYGSVVVQLAEDVKL